MSTPQAQALGRPSGFLIPRRLADRLGDPVLKWLSALAAIASVALIGAIIYEVIHEAQPAISAFGISFVGHEVWNPVTNSSAPPASSTGPS